MVKFILLFIFFGCNFLFAQTLKGKVFDTKGEPIPFAKIKVHNTTYGTVANAIGIYQLENLPIKVILQTSAVGFETKLDTLILEGELTSYFITLSDYVQTLDEIVIVSKTDKERGKEIMKKVIEKRPFFYDQLKEFSCETYCFGSLEKEIQDSIIKDSIIGKQSLNLLEWKGKSYYKADNKFKDEFYAYNDFNDENKVNISSGVSFNIDGAEQSIAGGLGTTSTNEYLFCDGFKDIAVNIFENQLSLPKISTNPIVSPMAFNALIYYNFFLEKSFIDKDSSFVYQIEVRPRFKEEALFYGTLFIRDENWEIVSMELGINPSALTYFKEMHIIIDFSKVNDRIVPTRREFIYYIKENKSKMNGSIRTIHSDYQFGLEDKKAKFWLETSVFKPEAFSNDTAYWNQIRPFKLREFEQRFIHQQDSAISYHESEEYLRKMDSTRNRIGILDVFFNGFGRVNSFKKQEIWFNPIIAQIIPLGVGGFRYRLETSYKKEFQNAHQLTLTPKIDYGFLNKDVKGRLGASYMYNPLRFSKVFFEIGDDYDFVTSVQNIQGTFAPGNRVRNQKIEVGYRTEITNGLYVKGSLLYSDRQSINNIKYPSWLDSAWGIFATPQPFPQYKIFLTTIDVEYHFRQKYYIRKNKKVVLGSPWPVIAFQYKKGIPNLAQAEADFDFIEFKITDEANLNTFGNLQTKLVFGSFLQKKDLRYIENKFFRTSDRIFFSNPVGTLQLLDTALNTSNSYLQFNFIHHFNGFFLNKIWLINKLKLEETIGGAMLYIPDAKFAQAEYYIGLERKFRIRRNLFKIGVYAVSADNNLAKAVFRFKLGVNFYEAFNGKWSY
jgi:hypothetical protein